MRTRAAGICGSDLIDWYVAKKAGQVIGHEVAGEIVEVGAGVTSFSAGDRVAPHHHAPCLECGDCRAGRFVHCAEWRSSRLDPGGMAEYVRIPAGNLARDTLKIPGALTFEEASFVEPLATVVKAFRRGALRAGQSVLVVGLGTVGQLARAPGPRAGRLPDRRRRPRPLPHRAGEGRRTGPKRSTWTARRSRRARAASPAARASTSCSSGRERRASSGRPTKRSRRAASPPLHDDAARGGRRAAGTRPLLPRVQPRALLLLRPRRHARSPGASRLAPRRRRRSRHAPLPPRERHQAFARAKDPNDSIKVMITF